MDVDNLFRHELFHDGCLYHWGISSENHMCVYCNLYDTPQSARIDVHKIVMWVPREQFLAIYSFQLKLLEVYIRVLLQPFGLL